MRLIRLNFETLTIINVVKRVFLIFVSFCFCIRINAQSCNYERIDTLIDNCEIKISKKSLLGLDLRYSFLKKKHRIFINYPDFSNDIIFPDTAILELTNTGVKKYYKLYLSDNILIVPLIGIGDSRLVILIINLERKKILADDIRTSFDFVWLKNENGLYLITSNTPILNDNDKYDYTIYLWEIEQNGIFKIKEKNIELEEDIRFYFNIDAQYSLIQKIWFPNPAIKSKN